MTANTNALPDFVDVVVLGSGAAGLTAALTASLDGRSVLLLEHLAVFGGTSARSSGTVWVPGSRAMRAAGHEDTQAEDYLAALVGELAPASLWREFLKAAPRMQTDLADRGGIRLRPCKAAPDYRQELPGAAPGWRAMEPLPFDGRLLGPDFEHLAPPLPEMMLLGGMMLTRSEATLLLRADRSPGAAWTGIRLMARYLVDRFAWSRGTRLVLGNSLVGQLLYAGKRAGAIMRRGVTTTRLIVEDHKVVGVVARGHAGETKVMARYGVILAGGGFPSNPAWLARELPKPTPRHSPASPGATGSTIALALEIGAVLGPSGLDNALWFPSSIATRVDGSTAIWPHIILDRAKPGSIIVDQRGQRFANEAVSYHEFVRAMYRSSAAIPCWMICDRRSIRAYGIGLIRPRTPVLRRYIRSGYLIEGRDHAELATKIGVPADALSETIARFNGFAKAGFDPNFRRGETIYERANGDPTSLGNPCLGPVGNGPLYAVRLEPTPLGTSRGLMIDPNSRVLRADGSSIEGLYACGNDAQSVFGGEYPGAGAQLGQGMTFAWLAARHQNFSRRTNNF
jgi:succinate dehydrogenase/fumarate reductase flavoprotein subunit